MLSKLISYHKDLAECKFFQGRNFDKKVGGAPSVKTAKSVKIPSKSFQIRISPRIWSTFRPKLVLSLTISIFYYKIK